MKKNFKFENIVVTPGGEFMEKKEYPQMKELEEAARPLVELIRKKYTPMTTVIVTGVYVELLSTEVGVSFNDD